MRLKCLETVQDTEVEEEAPAGEAMEEEVGEVRDEVEEAEDGEEDIREEVEDLGEENPEEVV